MINVSSAFKNQLKAGKRNFLSYIKVTLSDGTVLEIDNSKIMQNGLKIEDAVSSSGTFQIGSAIINKATITLNNIYDEYTGVDFEGANVVVNVGHELPDGTVESVKKGVYTVTSAKGRNSAVVTLECLDNMYKFDKDYSESKLTYPATIKQIVQDACDVCGVVLFTTTFDGEDYVIEKEPDKNGLTFRAVVMYAVQIIAKWAKCDVFGRLVIDWYKNELIVSERNIVTVDGKIITNTNGNPIKAIVEATEEDYLNDRVVNDMLRIESYFSDDIALNHSLITGVQIYETVNDVQIPYLYGSKGYVVTISENKLIAQGKEREIAKLIGDRVIGTSFHRMSVTTLSDPTIESGDRAYLITAKNKVYYTYINNTIFTIGNSQMFACEGEEPAAAENGRLDVNTQILVESGNKAAEKLNNYKMAVDLMTSIISNSLGMFTTQVQMANGGHIVYQHNKPLLEESDIIWLKTEQGFMVSTDGGETWNAGIDADGNAVVNVLSAVGINFDWARGGTLTLGGVLNRNGKLIILDVFGEQAGYIDNTGVNFRKGSINGMIIGGSTIYTNSSSGEIIMSNATLNFYDYDAYEDFQKAGSIYPTTDEVWVRYPQSDGSEIWFDTMMSGIQVDSNYWFNISLGGYDALTCMAGSYYDGIGVGPEGTSVSVDMLYATEVQTSGGIEIESLTASGTKSRVVKGTEFGDILMYCQESATPYFTDIGTGVINDDGECVVAIDSIFSETINANVEYCVFLQKEGQGDLWVAEKDFAYFTVQGTPGLKFSWELKAVQNGYEAYRMEDKTLKTNVSDSDAGKLLDNIFEQEEITDADFESISDY